MRLPLEDWRPWVAELYVGVTSIDSSLEGLTGNQELWLPGRKRAETSSWSVVQSTAWQFLRSFSWLRRSSRRSSTWKLRKILFWQIDPNISPPYAPLVSSCSHRDISTSTDLLPSWLHTKPDSEKSHIFTSPKFLHWMIGLFTNDVIDPRGFNSVGETLENRSVC